MAGRKTAQSTLKLAPVLDLNEASVLHGKLMEMRGKPLSVDASEVERVGVQCAQVLMAGIHAWEQDGKAFNITKASDAFDKTLHLIGVNVDHLLPKEIHE
jgi:chemotaxis protein CheX